MTGLEAIFVFGFIALVLLTLLCSLLAKFPKFTFVLMMIVGTANALVGSIPFAIFCYVFALAMHHKMKEKGDSFSEEIVENAVEEVANNDY